MKTGRVFLLVFILSALSVQSIYSITLPEKFSLETLVSGLNKPISLAFLPDGRMLVLQMEGRIMIGEGPNYNSMADYMTVTNVNSSINSSTQNERGLLGIAIDPDFSSNGYFYVYYSAHNPQFFRISRFKHLEMQGGLTSYGDISSETILWQDNEDYTNHFYHYGGGLDFGPDGKIYCALGDKFRGYMDPFKGMRAQDTSRYAGKILRLNKDGSIPDGSDGYAANPFINGPGLDAIWALGLRNPFKAKWDLPSGRYFIGEVGSNDEYPTAWEDIHICKVDSSYAGVNYGWPNCEGLPPFSNFPNCNIAGTLGEPLFSYEHTLYRGCIIGGVVYRGNNFPSTPYYGAYFYGDFVLGTLNYLTFDSIGNLADSGLFASGLNRLVAIEQGVDGFLYLIDYSGKLTRITYCSLNVSGAIVSEFGTAIGEVSFNLTGSGNKTFTSSNDGLYNFDVIQGNNCTITPSKNDDTITNNGISTLDIILVRRQILAIENLSSPYLIIAADVNNSQSISGLDVIFIRKVILQEWQTFPDGKLWAFVNSDFVFGSTSFPYDNFRSYTSLSEDQANQDFIGIKLGDVNNTWNSNIAKVGVGEVHFLMNDYTMIPNEEIFIPIKVKDFTHITGYQFTLSWDSKVLTLLEVINKSLSGNYGMQKIDEGYLTTSWNDDIVRAVSLRDDDTVVELKFRVVGAIGTQSVINIGSELTNSEAYNENFDLLSVESRNGLVKVGDTSTRMNKLLSVNNLHIQPNPFSNKANIIFNIPQEQAISIVIYDVLGNEIKHIKGGLMSGDQKIQWAGDDDSGKSLSNGLYHVRLNAKDISIGTRAVLLSY